MLIKNIKRKNKVKSIYGIDYNDTPKSEVVHFNYDTAYTHDILEGTGLCPYDDFPMQGATIVIAQHKVLQYDYKKGDILIIKNTFFDIAKTPQKRKNHQTKLYTTYHATFDNLSKDEFLECVEAVINLKGECDVSFWQYSMDYDGFENEEECILKKEDFNTFEKYVLSLGLNKDESV